MKATPARGTRDYLPGEERIRDYVRGVILSTYREFGFEKIATPMLEDIEHLEKSDGGENLGLIFKILKRGDKLEKAAQAGESLADMGLRYDLTLPLTRYFANNRAKLPMPFKCIQIDRVFRAERPQKGRLREFYQCDIDIIGTEGAGAELELIHTTATALSRIGFSDFTVRINDRRILRSSLLSAGFKKDQLDSVCITFDKLDKVGVEGVAAELTEKGFSSAAIAALSQMISSGLSLESAIGEETAVSELRFVIETANRLSGGRYTTVYDPSLVRGMGYYTGMVFEIGCQEFSGSIAGGGRYDEMVGNFLGEKIPAVGFSIGFERIFGILSERGFDIPQAKKRLALLYDTQDDIAQVITRADSIRGEGYEVNMMLKGKKMGKQIAVLPEWGYDFLLVFGREEIEALKK